MTTTSLKVWTFGEFVEAEMEEIPYLVDPLIPKNGITLLYGSAGAGKSAIGFHLVDVLGRGEDFLGLKTVRANGLYLNLEMPEAGLHTRLKKTGIRTLKSYLMTHPPIDVLQQGFSLSLFYREMKSIVKDWGIDLLVIDNLGVLHTQSVSNDEVARRTYAILREWFEDRAIFLLHHDKKKFYNFNTGEFVSGDEAASGSKYWINSAVSSIHLENANGDLRTMKHTKSQVSKMLEGQLKFTLGENAEVIPWEKKKADDNTAILTKAEMELRMKHPETWDVMQESEKVHLMATHLGKSAATIYRMKKTVEEVK